MAVAYLALSCPLLLLLIILKTSFLSESLSQGLFKVSSDKHLHLRLTQL